MDDFLVRALLGGLGVAVAAGPVGCFVVWRRMVYFGAALAHSALLGVALGFLLDINLTGGVVAVCLALAVVLLLLQRHPTVPMDTVLGVLAHVALAAGLVTLAFLESVRVDLMGYLFGDVLAVSERDLVLIWGLAAVSLVVMGLIWRDLLSVTVDRDLAQVEGVAVGRVETLFVLLLALLIGIGMKIVGMLLVLSMVVIPAAAARRFAATPERMVAGAIVVGAASVVLGLGASVRFDVPAGPAMVLACALAFLVSLLAPRRRRRAAGQVA